MVSRMSLPIASILFGHRFELLDAVLDGAGSAGRTIGAHVLRHGFLVDGDVLHLEDAKQELTIRRRYA